MNDSDGAARSYTRKYIRRREVIAYGFAGCGENMSYSMVTSYITYFFVNVFNIDPRIVSGMLFVEGLWDTINDPLMGALVDKTRTRWGKLRPYLLGVPIPLAIATAVLFGGPLLLGQYAPTDIRKVVYMVISYFYGKCFSQSRTYRSGGCRRQYLRMKTTGQRSSPLQNS